MQCATTLMRVARSILAPLPALLLLAAAAKAEDGITVAVAGPMTGRYASFGAQMRAGAEMAVEGLNRRGGVLGRRLVLEVADDRCERDEAVRAASGLVAAGIRFVTGHFCPSASIAAAPVYAGAGVIQISPSASNPRLREERAGPTVFRLAGRDEGQGEVAGRFIAEHFAGRRAAIVHDRTIYGREMAEGVRRGMRQSGVEEAHFEAIPPGEKDYGAVIARLKAAGVGVLYYGGYHTEAALIARQARREGAGWILIGGDVLATEEFWTLAGEAGEGTLLTFPPDATLSRGAGEVAPPLRLRERPLDAARYASMAFAAVQAWAAAVTAAHSLRPEDVAAALTRVPSATILGSIVFDASGNSSLPAYTVHAWRGGILEQLDGAMSSSPPPVGPRVGGALSGPATGP